MDVKWVAFVWCFFAGKMGKFYFSVSAGDSSINYDLKCRNWFWQQQSYWWYVVLGWMYTRVCPCDQRRVVSDRRWKFDVKEYFSSNGERVCYYERRPYWISTQVWRVYHYLYIHLIFHLNFCSVSQYIFISLHLPQTDRCDRRLPGEALGTNSITDN